MIKNLKNKLNKSGVKSHKLKTNDGQAMLLTVLLLGGVMLTVSTIASYLMILKIKASSDITNSTKAIFAADAGIEWELYKFKDSEYPKPKFSNGIIDNSVDFTTFNSVITLPDSTSTITIIKSIGKSSNSFRAFEMRLQEATSTP